MFEKIRDFFYNINDLIIAILIISLAAYIITWKIGDILSYPDQVVAQETSEPAPLDDVHTPDIPENEDIPDETSDEDPITDPDEEITNETPTESEEDPIDEPPTQPVNKISIDIPSGTAGERIASILKEKGLINNSSEFIDRLEERNLDVKLQAGTFKIPENASVDEVINILTGR